MGRIYQHRLRRRVYFTVSRSAGVFHSVRLLYEPDLSEIRRPDLEVLSQPILAPDPVILDRRQRRRLAMVHLPTPCAVRAVFAQPPHSRRLVGRAGVLFEFHADWRRQLYLFSARTSVAAILGDTANLVDRD